MRNNKIVIILLLLLFANTDAFTQTTTNSPYSKYGIGVLRPQTFASNFGMGGVGIGLRSNSDIQLINPASYSGIAVTTFDAGYTNNALWLKDGTESQSQNNSYIQHIAFAFPMIKNIWGMSFGVLPFSNTGYNYDKIINDSIAGDVSIYNKGEGAINRVYLGNALALKIDSTSVISAGANTSFLFGAMSYDQKVIYGSLPNSFNLWNVEELSVADFGADFGLQYQKKFKHENKHQNEDTYVLTIGATYGLSANLDAKKTQLIRTFTGNVDFGKIKDTALFIDNVDEIIQLPSALGFGLSIEKEKKWLFAVDYRTTDWAALTNNDPIFSYQSNYSLAAGLQFIPKNDANNYLKRIAYRFGTRYSTSYITINNTNWNEYGITFGIGLPVRKAAFNYPRLNFGFEYGNRGTTDAGLIKETFFNFNLGITINALWFRKRKYE